MERKKIVNSLSDTAANQIINYIQENKLVPEDKLPTEYELATMLAVSRSTIREAFKILVSRNILESRQGAGTFISDKRGIPTDPLGLTFIGDSSSLALDLINVRLMFEPEIAALATINATKENLQAIEDACTATEAAINAESSYYPEDILFHKAIADASGNLVVQNLVPIIHSSIKQSIAATSDALRGQTLLQHRKITNCIKDGDFQGARYAMILHLNANRDIIKDTSKTSSST